MVIFIQYKHGHVQTAFKMVIISTEQVELSRASQWWTLACRFHCAVTVHKIAGIFPIARHN